MNDIERILAHMQEEDRKFALSMPGLHWQSIPYGRMRNLLRAAIETSREIREERMARLLDDDVATPPQYVDQ